VAIKRPKGGRKDVRGKCGVGVATAGYGYAWLDPREMDFPLGVRE